MIDIEAQFVITIDYGTLDSAAIRRHEKKARRALRKLALAIKRGAKCKVRSKR